MPCSHCVCLEFIHPHASDNKPMSCAKYTDKTITIGNWKE